MFLVLLVIMLRNGTLQTVCILTVHTVAGAATGDGVGPERDAGRGGPCRLRRESLEGKLFKKAREV